jgi:hypothetical protein
MTCIWYTPWKDATPPLQTVECEHWTGEKCLRNEDCPKPWEKKDKK